jgi:hypothetical protein
LDISNLKDKVQSIDNKIKEIFSDNQNSTVLKLDISIDKSLSKKYRVLELLFNDLLNYSEQDLINLILRDGINYRIAALGIANLELNEKSSDFS